MQEPDAEDDPSGGVSQRAQGNETERRQNHKKALEARADLRLAWKFARKRACGGQLTTHECSLLKLFDEDELRQKVNAMTAQTGHGRLRGKDGQYMDIGGSTGGSTRRILDGYAMPHWREFNLD